MSVLAALLVGLLVPSASLSTLGAYDPTQPINDKSPGVGGGPGGGGPGDPPPPATRKVALGISMPDNRDMATLDGFTASNNGHQPALWSVWTQWGLDTTQDFPTDTAEALRTRGVTPFIFWEPWDPRDEGSRDYRYERIASGALDGYIRSFARDAKAFGELVILRFAHEANGGYFPWVVGQTDNTREQYLDAWRHVWTIFDQEGASNVKFLWSVAKQKCVGCNPYADFYPGDKYVDYMGFSSFNWGAEDGKVWSTMYDGYKLVTNHLASISNKPIIVAETGSNDVGGDKGAWINDGYREVYDKLPQIVAIMYLNFDLRKDGHPDWSLTRFGGSKYALISGLSQFKGKLTLKASQRAKALARVKAQNAKARTSAKVRQQAEAAAPAKRVLKGTQETNAKSGPVGAHKAKTTKPPRRRSPEPPQVLDALER